MFADQTTTLKTRRNVLASALGLATVATTAYGTTINPNPRPKPPADLANLASEWVAMADRVRGMDEGDVDDLHDEIKALHGRLVKAMRSAGVVALVVGGRLVIDSWQAEPIPDAPEFGVGVVDLASVVGL